MKTNKTNHNADGIAIADSVTIGTIKYKVVSTTYSGSRGLEYKLEHPNYKGIVSRVCHAPTYKVGAAVTSGEIITYHWKATVAAPVPA